MTNGHKIKITDENKEMYRQAVGNKTVMKLGSGKCVCKLLTYLMWRWLNNAMFLVGLKFLELNKS